MWSVRSRRRESSVDLADVLGTAVQPRDMPGPAIDVEAELGGDDHLVPERGQSLADDVLVGERAVDLGRVEEGDAPLHRSTDDVDCVVPVGWHPITGAESTHRSREPRPRDRSSLAVVFSCRLSSTGHRPYRLPGMSMSIPWRRR